MRDWSNEYIKTLFPGSPGSHTIRRLQFQQVVPAQSGPDDAQAAFLGRLRLEFLDIAVYQVRYRDILYCPWVAVLPGLSAILGILRPLLGRCPGPERVADRSVALLADDCSTPFRPASETSPLWTHAWYTQGAG